MLLCPAELQGAVGKGLQTEMALPQIPLPAMQFKCTISVNINNLEGLQFIKRGIICHLHVTWQEFHSFPLHIISLCLLQV